MKICTNIVKYYLTVTHIKKPDYLNRSTDIRINMCLCDMIVEQFVNKSRTVEPASATVFMQLTHNIQSYLRPILLVIYMATKSSKKSVRF